MAVKLPRVCSECFKYFVTVFGKETAYYASRKFLEYKNDMGLSRQAINPGTISRESYITSAELDGISTDAAARSTQPLQVRSPIPVEHISIPPPSKPRPLLPPDVYQDALRERRLMQSEKKSNSTAPRVQETGPTARQRLDRLDRANRNARDGPARIENRSRNQNLEEPIGLLDPANDNNFIRGRTQISMPYQPVPIRSMEAPRDPLHKLSDSSLVKRITTMADTVQIAGYPSPESEGQPSAPKLEQAPKIPGWRSDTFRPATPDEGHHGPTFACPTVPPRAASATCMRTVSSMDSLVSNEPRSHSVSNELVPVPAHRTAGICVSSSARHYKEHGVPSAAYLEEESHEEKPRASNPPSAMLVSIKTPSPSYSCAVQSCFCSPEEEDDEVCPACRDRRRLEGELQMTWI